MNFIETKACILRIANIGKRIINQYLKQSRDKKDLTDKYTEKTIQCCVSRISFLLVLSLNITSDLPNTIIVSVLLSN